MEGFVKNVSPKWMYAMKRSIQPGGEIKLKELYEQYGKKHNMRFDDEFINWLKTIKLKGSDKWKIVYDFTDVKVDNKQVSSNEVEVENKTNDNVTPLVAKKMEVADIVNLTVRKAREVIPKVTDLTLLKYSLSEAKQLSNKDSLCQIIQKRVVDLQIAR